jgi:hypothetical protein
MSLSKAALFASGVFFGGAIDHAILAAMRRDRTPYGIRSSVAGNWLFAAADLALAAVLYHLHTTEESAALVRGTSVPPATARD